VSKVITAEQAAAFIKDGATLGYSAFLTAGFPEELGIAIEKRFLADGHPAGLTVIQGASAGDWKTRGMQHFAHAGLVKRWIGAWTGDAPAMAQMIMDGQCEAYDLPQGVVLQLWREIAAHRAGLITKVGLGTFVDPRVEGGKVNKITTRDLVKVIQLEGEEWLYYPPFKVDVALIRGTVGDENGNLTEDTEGALLECLPLAQAAKNSGGIVIAEIAYLAQSGTVHPKRVRVPGVLIDYLVIASEEHHWQGGRTRFNPAFSGDVRMPMAAIPPLPLDERLIIGRRAAMELVPGAVVNLGIGVPECVAAAAATEGASDLLTLTTELGVIGGVPAGREDFGMSYNPLAFVEQQAQFDWYDGGGLDVAFLGAAEVDSHGNVNVSKFHGRFTGCGGFINISQNSKKVVYCGSLTTGGLKVAVEDGKLVIKQEGKARKYVKSVEQVTFSGAYATKIKQPVLYVTERAVFELQNGEVTLIEIAPGMNLERDVLAQMEFTPRISPNLKLMPSGIFRQNWGELRRIIENKRQAVAVSAA
jgi:propionate CoA-transferase